MACRWHQTARSPNLFGAAAWRATKEMACRWHSDSGRLISLVSLVPQHRLGRAGHRVRQRARPAEVWTRRIKEMVQPMICLHAVSLVLRTAHTAHTAHAIAPAAAAAVTAQTRHTQHTRHATHTQGDTQHTRHRRTPHNIH